MKTFYGIPASAGSIVAKVRLCTQSLPQFSRWMEGTDSEAVSDEYEKFLSARNRCLDWLNALETTEDEMREVYCELLQDASLEEDVLTAIQTEHLSAPAAVEQVLTATADEMAEIPDEYMRQRAEDLRALAKSLLRTILEMPLDGSVLDNEPFVLVGEDVSPLDWMHADARFLRGVVSGSGAKTSHIAFLATGREVPAVLGLGTSAIAEIHAGQKVLVDGNSGRVVIEPDAKMSQEAMATNELEAQNLNELIHAPCQTADGRRFALMANIATVDDVRIAEKYGADGVGLFRTEFLFLDATPPDEETQYSIYTQIATTLAGKPFTIRTFDVGADKTIPAIALPTEQNPFLGVRGCRVYAENKDFFFTQLRAILRASTVGNVRMMFPMITTVAEVDTLLAWVEEAKRELSACGKMFGSPEIGIMIETPAAAMIADELAEKVDFFSIGTNDLTQYTLAADRGNPNPAVSTLFSSPHPAVLRLIEHSIVAAHRHGKHVSICGELASEPRLASMFLDFGLDVWSMSPAKIPCVKRQLLAEFGFG